MTQPFLTLSNQIADAVERAAAAVVQVHGHHRPTSGVVFADGLVVAPSRALSDDTALVRLASGDTTDAAVLGHAHALGLAVLRVSGAGSVITPAPEARVGQLAIAVGRTWSGGVMASVTNVAVVGGPLRTTRTGQIDRVIRIAHEPHGALTGGALIGGDGQALGVITGASIRGTAVVVPASIAFTAAQHLAATGGSRQGFLGVSSTTVTLPAHQRGGRSHERGLLVTGVVGDGPAAAAGVMVGDIIMDFEHQPVEEPETLLTLLRGDRIGTAVTLTVQRGVKVEQVAVTVGERPRSERSRRARSR